MHRHIEVDETEHGLLLEVLSERMVALRDEVQHTDNRAFKDGLKIDKAKLQELTDRVRNAKSEQP